MLYRKKTIILVGGGGHCKVIIDAIKKSRKFIIYGVIDKNLAKGTSILGSKVIGRDNMLPMIFKQGIKNAFISVGSTGNCGIRKKICDNLKNIGFKLPIITHPNSVIAEDVKFGEGTFVAAGAVINPGVKIGKNVIINTSSSVDHDCEIADFVHIAPGVTLSGNVKIGSQTHIGTGTKIIQGLSIGKNCMVKAGELVRRDVPDNITYSDRIYEEYLKRE